MRSNRRTISRKILAGILASAAMIISIVPAAHADGLDMDAMLQEIETELDKREEQESLANAGSLLDEISQELDERLERERAAENAYALRIQYTEELMQENLYDLRMLYAESAQTGGIREQLVNYALSWVGVTPYVWAGGDLYTGTDCSGFVRLIFQAFGYDLPSGSDAYQYMVGYHVSWEDLKPADIIVYDGGEHVGIYAGNGLVVHCSSPENGTVVWDCTYRNITALVRVID